MCVCGVCVCLCVCVCSPRSVPCLSHSLTTLVTHTHIHKQPYFTLFTVAFVVFRLKITQPCVFCRSKGLLKCCPYVTHIHTYNTNIQKINCLHIHRYAYLYEHALFVYQPLNYIVFIVINKTFTLVHVAENGCRECLRVCLICVMRFSACVLCHIE